MASRSLVMALDSVTQSGSNQASSAVALTQISHAQLEELMDAGEQAHALLDPSIDKIIWCSAGWLSTFPDWVVGESWELILGSSQKLADLYRSLENQSRIAETIANPLSGDLLDFQLYTLSDGIIGLRAVARPMTAENIHLYMQARENMFTTSRTISVSEMATTLAHEIKQPIATIANLLKGVRLRLKRESVTSSEVDDAIDNALEQANFTNSIINRIRDFTQARRPQQQMLDLAQLTRESMSLMDWFLSANHCLTELKFADEPLFCKGDPTMLQQVLVNLLRNGVEAMHECDPSDRQLVVACEQRGAYVRISIRDSGQGLDDNEQSLYIPFSTNKANGMGVGLNICRSFVELHQGRLWLSPNPEGGCTSHMELPIAHVSETKDSSVKHHTEGT